MKISLVHKGVSYLDYDMSDLGQVGVPLAVILKQFIENQSDQIDAAAGEARAAFVSPGSYIDQEYLLAKQEAADWLAGEKDASTVPSSVADHMAMFDVDPETAAEEIVATAEQWETALREIRQIRLGGKASVQRADTIEAAEETAQLAIEQLNQYRPPEGAQ